jgi:hypothetical protein
LEAIDEFNSVALGASNNLNRYLFLGKTAEIQAAGYISSYIDR